MNVATEKSGSGFPQSYWSIVLQPDASAESGRAALGKLCRRYWLPVYAHVRRAGHPPAIAQDITRTFLHRLEHGAVAEVPPAPRPRFRDYLLGKLHDFLAGDWRELQDDDEDPEDPPFAGLEARYQRECTHCATPDEAFQCSFANEVITRAMARLREEAEHNGHGDMYDALLPYLSRDPQPGDVDALATRLDRRPLALMVALKRLRQRFRELAGRELSDTVSSSGELADEQRTLHAILRSVR